MRRVRKMLAALGLVCIVCGVWTVAGMGAGPLFIGVEILPAFTPSMAREEVEVVRSRYVQVNFELLAPPPEVEPSATVLLNLFPELLLTARLERFEVTRSGHAWTGRVEGVEHSQVILVVVDGVLSGSVWLPGAFFLVEYAGDGLHGIYEIKEGQVPEDPPVTPRPPRPPEGYHLTPSEPPFTADDGSIIDVMVVYTPAARAGAGGTTQIQALIDQAVVGTNQAYANSNVTQRLRLVYTTEVSYTESGSLSTDLNRLQNPSDGYMDAVHAWRNTYGADLVSLFVESSTDGYAGIGFLMDAAWFRPAFEAWAFTVVVRQYAVANYTFAHELGHNMGADHDWYVSAGSNLAFSYARGHVKTWGGWRTIMAYSNKCAQCSGYVSCPKIPHFSNPAVNYGGVPTGVPGGTNTSCTNGNCSNPPCDADVARTFNNTAYTVANFRQSVLVGTPAVFRVDRATGHVLADGAFYGSGFTSGSADIAEWVPVSETVEPGDVLEIDPTRPGHYRLTRGPCSYLVAGVVSTQPGVVLGSSPHSSHLTPHALLALLGIVPVKVTDENGPIRVGDLLVASSTPGHAMRWDPGHGAPCGLVGKALEAHGGGTGRITVLLMR